MALYVCILPIARTTIRTITMKCMVMMRPSIPSTRPKPMFKRSLWPRLKSVLGIEFGMAGLYTPTVDLHLKTALYSFDLFPSCRFLLESFNMSENVKKTLQLIALFCGAITGIAAVVKIAIDIGHGWSYIGAGLVLILLVGWVVLWAWSVFDVARGEPDCASGFFVVMCILGAIAPALVTPPEDLPRLRTCLQIA